LVFFFDFRQAAVFVGIFEGGLQEVAGFGEGLGEGPVVVFVVFVVL